MDVKTLEALPPETWKCANCLYYGGQEDGASPRCHRQAGQGREPGGRAVWPTVGESDHCGEFEMRRKAATAEDGRKVAELMNRANR